MPLRFPHVNPIGRTILLAISLLATHSAAAAGSGMAATFNVASNGSSSWTINAQSNPPLTLLRGQTYEFVMQNVGAMHPFNINTINTTGSASQYNNGVTNTAQPAHRP